MNKSVLTISPSISAKTMGEIDEYLTKPQDSSFNCVILIAKNNQILLHKAYGAADSNHNIPLTIDSVMPVLGWDFWSFFWNPAKILLMADQGRISLDDPISSFIPDCPKAWDAITIRDIMLFKSGLPNPFDGLTQAEIEKLVSSPTSFEESIAIIRDKPLVTIQAPATAHWTWATYPIQYRIIVEIQGGIKSDYTIKNLLEPLGIIHLGREYDGTVVAAGHDGSMNPTNISAVHETIYYPLWMISNAKEIYMVLQELLDPTILSQESGKIIRTEISFDNVPITANLLGITNSGFDIPGSSYKWNFPEGYSGIYLVSPEDKLIIVICSNQKDKDFKEIINFIATKISGND